MSLAVKSPKKMKSKSSWRHRIELLHTLGEGTYGKVKLAVDSKTGEKMAVKYMMKKKMSTEQDMQRVRREIKILASINHEHIVQIYEVFENKEKFVIVMEYIDGGELYEYVNARGVLSDKDSRRIFRQVVAAVHHLHQAGVVHRDLKLENILLDSKGNVKLADFGLSNWWQHNRFLHTFCGSPLYASPEIVNGRPYYGPEVDTWSLGVILYTLVYGAMPFDGTNFERLRSQITSGDYYEPTRPSDAASLIRRLLTVNPAKRASVADVCRHWWTNVDCARSLWHEVQEVKAKSQADKRTSDYFEDDSLFVEPDQQLPGAAATEAAADEAPAHRQQQHPERSAGDERRAAAVTWDAGSSSSRCLAPSTATTEGPAAERRAILPPGSETAAKCSSGDSGCALADQCIVAAGDGSADGARSASAEEQEPPTACLATAAAGGCRYSMSDIDAVLNALDGSGAALRTGSSAAVSAAAAAAASAATHTASPAAAAVVGQVSLPPAESRVSPGCRRRSISVLHGSVIVDRDATAASLLDAKSGGDCGTAAARAEAQQQRARSASLNASKLVRCAVRDSDRKQRTDGGSVSSQSSCGNLLDFDNSDSSSDDNL